jgi:hypothetical protein
MLEINFRSYVFVRSSNIFIYDSEPYAFLLHLTLCFFIRNRLKENKVIRQIKFLSLCSALHLYRVADLLLFIKTLV